MYIHTSIIGGDDRLLQICSEHVRSELVKARKAKVRPGTVIQRGQNHAKQWPLLAGVETFCYFVQPMD